jgi:phage baseplate assembly protein W
MAAEFAGVGWGFPVGVGQDGTIRRVADEEGIREAVWLILSTAKGERVMHPDFGCGIHDLIFGGTGATITGQIAAAVREALVLWEPRIQLEDVRVATDPATSALPLVRIQYRVRSTNNVFNLVYPFYLEKGAV